MSGYNFLGQRQDLMNSRNQDAEQSCSKKFAPSTMSHLEEIEVINTDCPNSSTDMRTTSKQTHDLSFPSVTSLLSYDSYSESNLSLGSAPIIGSPVYGDSPIIGSPLSQISSWTPCFGGFDGPGLITNSTSEDEDKDEGTHIPFPEMRPKRKSLIDARSEFELPQRLHSVGHIAPHRRLDNLCKRHSVASISTDRFIMSTNPIDQDSDDDSDPPKILSETEKHLIELYDILGITPERRLELAQINTAVLYDPKEFRTEEGSQYPLAASFTQLILWLTDLKVGPRDQALFVKTFPSFETPPNFMAALFTRYYADPKAENSNVRDDKELRVLQHRVLGLLSVWMKNKAQYQWENNNNIQAMEKFIDFVKKEETSGYSELNESARVLVLQAALDRLKNGEEVLIYSFEEPPPMILPKGNERDWTIDIIDPVELARQVSLYHKETFQKIGPTELFATIWGTQKSGEAKNMNELTKHFDLFSRYVQLSIIRGRDPKERAKMYWHWVQVANEFRKMHNFHGMFSVMCGITHRSVERLAQTMKKVNKAGKKDKKMLEDLSKLTDFGSDYGNYRTMLSGFVEDCPCVPFIGCFQKDLVYVQDMFPNRIDGLINVKKCQECLNLVTFVMQKQNKGHYNFTFYARIRELITCLKDLPDTTEMMKLSIAAEKKQ